MTTAFDVAPDAATVRLNGPVVRFACRVLGWSQAEFARRIEVHPATASRMLSGQPTTAGQARKVMHAIPGLTIEEVVDLGELSAHLPAGAVDYEPPA